MLGGLERVVEAWATELAKKGIDVCVVTNTTNTAPDAFVFSVYRGLSFWKLVALMRGMDVIIQFNVSLKGLPAWWLSRKPLAISHHTFLVEKNKPASWRQRLKLMVSNRFPRQNICCSHFIAGQFSKATVVHSPFQSQIFYAGSSERKPGSLVFAGRLVTDKGVDLLLKALAQLDSNLFTSLTIIGDGPEKGPLEELSSGLLISNRVQFIGALSAVEVAAILGSSEIMIVPSVVEPFGITVLEGLASGCRMVVSDTGGLPEAAGGFARIFESGDVKALAASIMEELTEPVFVNREAVVRHLEKMTVEYTAGQFLEEVMASVSTGLRARITVGSSTS